MKIIKRNGSEVEFNREKIANAINAANAAVAENAKIFESQVQAITDDVVRACENLGRVPTVENVQDLVEKALVGMGNYTLAKEYITYRYTRELRRKSNTTDDSILSLIDLNNEVIKAENSNKNPVIASTQRDYMAGEVSKDLSRRVLLPKDIVQAHDDGIIHFHDMDYYSNKIHNCDVWDLEDMLQNGTVISGVMIEKPHSFHTACNIATQIVSQVASSQYGGQTFSLAHLAPFVDVSRKKFEREIEQTCPEIGEETKRKIVNSRIKDEIKKGVQTMQYQLVTLMTTNGQTPFVSMFMYLDEAPEGQTRDDLALIIEEVLNQRIQGVKNKDGVWITPAFPKLLYVLDEDNVREGSKYWELTQLAAKCTAKRMVPDYISAKVMKELKQGEVYPCMGCVDGKEVIRYELFGVRYTESFERAWDRIRCYFPVKLQPDGINHYIDCGDHVKIWDTKKGYVKCYRFIRNIQNEWLQVTLDGGRTIRVTADHPFEVEGVGVVLASELRIGDEILKAKPASISEGFLYNRNRAWLLGFMLCDGCYDKHAFISIAETGEDDIEEKFKRIIKEEYNLDSYTVNQNRGRKGVYKDIYVKSDGSETLQKMIAEFYSLFEGRTKATRHIPNEVFTWDRESKLNFLAGMIDADGYLNERSDAIQIGSTNKELAIGQLYLALDLGFCAKIYENKYSANSKKTRYRVEFFCNEELANLLCQKKRTHFCNVSKTTSQKTTVRNITSSIYTSYSYDVTTESEHFEVSGIYSHNCRSFLTVEDNFMLPNGHHKFYGRFNQGVVTINLPDVACASYGDFDKFWEILEERLELCHRALRCRHERLLGTKSDIAPILWQHGAIARLQPGETIDKLLFDGYSTISLGYSGLYETCVRMTGKSHTDPEAKPFALAVMQKLNDKCAEWRAAENIAYSVYGTPMESTTYKFAKAVQDRYGKIKDVSDHNYQTNSYHVVVREQIDAFSKLKFESEFQKLSPGGAISYVEVPNMQDNIPAVISIMQYIYDNIMYAELNTKSDYCSECGFDGEIQIIEEDGKLLWECPNCGNRNQDTMSVARRTCGYIGSNYWNFGRTEEISERVMHVSVDV